MYRRWRLGSFTFWLGANGSMIFRLPNQISDPAAACGEPGPVEENGVPQTGIVLTDEDRKRIAENHKKAIGKRDGCGNANPSDKCFARAEPLNKGFAQKCSTLIYMNP